MLRRVLSCITFLTGGIIAFFVLSVFAALGHMQAGMSAVSVAGKTNCDAVILRLTCSYFVINAIGVCVTQKKSVLMAVCIISHLVLFIAFCLLCSEGFGGSVGTFVGGLLALSIGMAIFFCPWFITWGLILKKADNNATNC